MIPINRAPLKPPKVLLTGQQKRRELFLQRQAEARRNLTNRARSIIVEANENEMESVSGGSVDSNSNQKNSKELRYLKKREYWSSQFCTPEWMLEVPPKLDEWFVLPRPEGKRVMIIAQNHKTHARGMNGSILFSWKSVLPFGGSDTKGKGITMLDCIYHEMDRSFYVLDMLSWNDLCISDYTCEFRLYWIRTKFDEISAHEVTPENEYSIRCLPYFECSADGLTAAYSSQLPYIRDGLLFLYKAAYYDRGVSPLMLLWKDSFSTRYLLSERDQSVVLRASIAAELSEKWYEFSTSDSPPVALHRCKAEGKLKKLKQGDLVRFEVSTVYLMESSDSDAVVRVENIQFDKFCSPVRPAADSISKILFQSGIRTENGHISFEDIMKHFSQIQGMNIDIT